MQKRISDLTETLRNHGIDPPPSEYDTEMFKTEQGKADKVTLLGLYTKLANLQY